MKFPKSWLETLPLRQKIHHFFFSHTWGTRFKYLPEGCPYMLMYSALHIMKWFSGCLDVFTRKSDENFSILTFSWIKTTVAYTRLEVIAKQHSTLQVEFITGVKLICYFVLYYCFLHWSHLPNMAVGDLAFYYILYLCCIHGSSCQCSCRVPSKYPKRYPNLQWPQQYCIIWDLCRLLEESECVVKCVPIVTGKVLVDSRLTVLLSTSVYTRR